MTAGAHFAIGVAIAWPLVAWTLLARTKRVGLTLGALLLAWAAFGGSLIVSGLHGWRLYAALSYAPVSALVIVIGVGLDRGRLPEGWAPLSKRRGFGFTVLLFCGVFIGLVATPLVALAASLRPATAPVFPLPKSLTDREHDLGCGSDTCTKDYLVTSTGTHTHDNTEAQLRNFLVNTRGWVLDSTGSGCRPTGLFDSETVCVSISRTSRGVDLSVSTTNQWFG